MKRIAQSETESLRKKSKLCALGVIDSITLRNFMCHDHLNFTLQPNTNFIIGENGSGKSAILTGAILALGGKSSTTGRYSNTRGFVKTGKQKATITVVLKNEGRFSYKPELYGNQVIIERELTVEGASIYKLKSASGKIISGQKSELKHVLESMDIRVENPVCVLTQEVSRSFLTSKHGKGESLYKIFYEGTGLKVLEESYNDLRCSHMSTATEISRKKEALVLVSKEIERWKRLVDGTKKIHELEGEYLWSNAIVVEKETEEKEKEVQKTEKELRRLQKENERIEEKLGSLNEDVDTLKVRKDKLLEKMEHYRGQVNEAKASFDQESSCLTRKEEQVKSLKRKEVNLLRDKDSLENVINENKLKDNQSMEEERHQRELRIQKLKDENERLESNIDDLNEEKNLQLDQEPLSRKMDEKHAELQYLKTEKENLTRELQQIKVGSKNRLNAFGKSASNILDDLSREANNFQKMPKGPLGHYVEVIDPKWNFAIQSSLSINLLNSYCCDNENDARRLKAILRKYYGQNIPTVITSRFLTNVHDVSRYKAETTYPTVLDMLRIKDPVVANCLIDQCSIENKILIEGKSDADRLLDNPPLRVNTAYLPNCDEMCFKPSIRMYSCSRPPTWSVFNTRSDHDMTAISKKLEMYDAKIRENQQEQASMGNKLKEYHELMMQLDKKIADCQMRIRNNKRGIGELESVQEDVHDIDEMQEDLNVCNAELAKLQEQIDQCESERDTAKETFQKTRQKLEEAQSSLKEDSTKYSILTADIKDSSAKKEMLASGKRENTIEIKSLERKLLKEQEELKTEQEQVKEAVLIAERHCPRIDTDRTPEDVKRNLDETRKVIQETSECSSVDEIKRKYQTKNAKYVGSKIELQAIEELLKFIQDMLAKRVAGFKSLRGFCETSLNLVFSTILRGNQMHGSMKFDHTKCTLELQAMPARRDKQASKNQQLSGGERSFTNIALLLALWEQMKSPFVMLDEYDVFMDTTNRQLSVELLINFAKKFSDRQFVFLSPLDLPDLSVYRTKNPGVDIKVHYLQPPQRVGRTPQGEEQ